MTTSEPHVRNDLRPLLQRWFERSLTHQQAGRILQRLVGRAAGRQGLCILAEEVVVSRAVMETGGHWTCVSILDRPGPLAETVAGAAPETLREGRLPFADGRFDLVLMDQVLEHFQEDRAFIAEVHRVLKPDGILVLSAAVSKRWSLVAAIRSLFRLDAKSAGWARPGYTPSALFDVLKDGFDAEEVAAWSRFFSELMDVLIRVLLALGGGGSSVGDGGAGDEERLLMRCRRTVRIHSLTYPLARLVAMLDYLLPFTRGYRLAYRARRRPWRPRRAPSLRDGRSIAEAAINTKIGTAAPF